MLKKTLKTENSLRIMLRLIFSHSKFLHCLHTISLILSEPAHCPSKISILHLMHAIARAHASTRATTSMRVNISTRQFCYDTYCLAQWKEENERKNKNLCFVNLSLA